VTHYVVTPYLGSSALASHVVKSGKTSDVVSGLVNGKTYRFRVTAKTDHGSGPPSGPTNAVTIGVPTAPTAVTAVSRAGRIVVRWKAPTTTNGSRLTAYIVTPYRNGKALPARMLSPQATVAKIAGLTAGRTYTFRVAALNHRGLGSQSPASNRSVAIAAHNFAVVHALLSWFA
jgi:fibronectin type 3 domain-containing protein